MEIRQQCDICKQRLAMYSCGLCGANVCEADYDKKTGLCVNCKRKEMI